MELWQIGESEYAPKFQVISQPNDWAKVVKQTASGNNKITETKAQQLEFWTSLKQYAEQHNTTLRFRKPSHQHWYDLSIGSSEAHIALTVNSRLNRIACELYIHDSKELYYFLEKNKDRIERELGYKVEWFPLEGKKASSIRAKNEADFNDTENWTEYHKWLLGTAEKFHLVFAKLIKHYK